MLNKNHIPVIVVLCLMLSAASAAIIVKYKTASRKTVNIFERTKNECAGLKWIDAIDSTDKVSPITIEGDLYFAGERVPLEDPDVKERLDRELQLNVYWHSNTISAMRLANRYFDDIEKVLNKKGVPTDFKYLSLIESGFRNEISPAGATGYWQFLKETGRKYGLEINGEVDERFHIEKSTAAAADYLKEGHDKLGNWTIAAAAYNLGIPGMGARIKDQKTNNYYDMYFNQETSRYLFRMIAMKIIFSNPERAGFYLKPEELYQPYAFKEVEVDSTISSIADFAAQYGLKYKHIKIMNTWLREASLTNKERKKYQIKIMELD